MSKGFGHVLAGLPLLALAWLLAPAAASAQPVPEIVAREGYADAILVNGKIVSMDDASISSEPGRTYQAMAIKRDRIMKLGTNEEVRALATAFTKVYDLKGRTVVLDFWASWCAPCREQSEILNQAMTHLGDDVYVLGIATSDQRAAAEEFVKTHSPAYPTAFDEGGQVGAALGITQLPTLVIINPRGEIRTFLAKVVPPEELLNLVKAAKDTGV